MSPRAPWTGNTAPKTRSIDALRDGIARVARAPVILACVFVATLMTALPLSIAMRDALQAHLGDSLAAEQVARGVNVQWWSEFTQQAGTLGKTFQPSIIGFAAVLDNISALADGEARPSPLVWLGAGYLLLWLFLTGGILDRYARARPARSYEFFTACGMYFVRFLRLAPFIGLSYYVLFALVHPVLLEDAFSALTRDVTAERSMFFIRIGLYAIFGLLLVLVNIVFDYAKVRAVVEDRRSMIGAILAGARFARRNAPAVASLYLLTAALFVALLLVYALAAPGGGATGAAVWIGFAISQLYLVGRLWIRLVFLASETALFQARLAHAGYVAGGAITRPEPPIVDNVL
jgi:hypothetical protein